LIKRLGFLFGITVIVISLSNPVTIIDMNDQHSRELLGALNPGLPLHFRHLVAIFTSEPLRAIAHLRRETKRGPSYYVHGTAWKAKRIHFVLYTAPSRIDRSEVSVRQRCVSLLKATTLPPTRVSIVEVQQP
jgi:hypothetical protein